MKNLENSKGMLPFEFEISKAIAIRVINFCSGNQTQAAKVLNINRNTLRQIN